MIQPVRVAQDSDIEATTEHSGTEADTGLKKWRWVGRSNTTSRASNPALPSSPKKMSRTMQLRVLFVASMLIALVTCATVAFIMMRDLQIEIARQTYESIAMSALVSAKEITRRKINAASVMEAIMSNAFPDADMWPFVGLDGYYLISNEVAAIGSATNASMQIGLLVLVQPGEEAYAFEEHAKRYYEEQGYPADAGTTAAGFGIRRADKNSTSGYALDRTGEYSTFGSTNKVLVPVLDHSTWNSPMLMYDTHVSSKAIDSIIECSERHRDNPLVSNQSLHEHFGILCQKPICSVISGFRMKDEDVIALIYKPIYPMHDPHSLVGMIGISVNFKDVLQSVIPDYFHGIHAVLSTHKNIKTEDYSDIEATTVTYEIQNGTPKLKAAGDLHRKDFDGYGRSIDLNDFGTDASDAVTYTLTFYPSNFSQYQTASPAVVAAGMTACIIACSIMFMIYDNLMIRQSNEQRAILTMKRRFVRFISHEIRSPLSTVCMGIELLESDLRAFCTRKPEEDQKGAPPVKALEGNADGKMHVDESSLKSWHEMTCDIKDNAAGAVAILDDLLTYDKIETGAFHIEADAVNIVELVQKTTKRFQLQAINKKVNLTLEIQCPHETHLPAGQLDWKSPPNLSASMVVGDAIRLSQVISNLLSNALKFTTSGGSVQVNLSCCFCSCSICSTCHLLGKRDLVDGGVACEDPIVGFVTINVKDTGVGLTKKQIEKIFDEGVQFDATKLQAGGGSGLGLCIAKGIIERHNGVIRAMSEGKGKGSTFSIQLPLYDLAVQGTFLLSNVEKGLKWAEMSVTPNSSCPPEDDASLNATTVASEDIVKAAFAIGQPDAPELKTHHILVVEDVASSRKMLIRLLERAGHSCVPACDGKEAIDAVLESMLPGIQEDIEEGVRKKEFDTVCMDYEMPNCNGPDATAEIRRLGYKGMVVGVTGNLLKEDVDHFLAKGADDVLPKPVTVELINDCWARHHHECIQCQPRKCIAAKRKKSAAILSPRSAGVEKSMSQPDIWC